MINIGTEVVKDQDTKMKESTIAVSVEIAASTEEQSNYSQNIVNEVQKLSI